MIYLVFYQLAEHGKRCVMCKRPADFIYIPTKEPLCPACKENNDDCIRRKI